MKVRSQHAKSEIDRLSADFADDLYRIIDDNMHDFVEKQKKRGERRQMTSARIRSARGLALVGKITSGGGN